MFDIGWTEMLVISGGIVLLIMSYIFWRGADSAESTPRMLFRMGAALALAIGAWVLIAELPAAIAAGNDDWWESLLNTVWFAMFTIPIQFTISLSLASILFMNLRGQAGFRVAYFLPYIAPLVGTAAAFRIILADPSVDAELPGYPNEGRARGDPNTLDWYQYTL